MRPSCCAVPVLAQEQADPFTSAKVHLGPFAVTPTVALTDVGVDTNVFNCWDNQQGDWTATVKAGADTWLRLGKARLNMKVGVGYVYFMEFDTERSWNTDDSARLELPLTHFRPWIGVSYLNVKERPGYEIDVRARRTETSISTGLDYVWSKKLTIGLGAKKKRTDFPSDETFADTYLRDVLNRDYSAATASVRYGLTPLTTIVVEGAIERERFEFSPERDSNGFRLVPGVEFDPHALISGSARVGYRNLKMLTPGMPDYTGPVASVNLAYRLLGVTRFEVRVSRDVDYSYEVFEPYYVLTGLTGSVTQSVGGPWALVARYGQQHLAYQRVSLARRGAKLQLRRSVRARCGPKLRRCLRPHRQSRLLRRRPLLPPRPLHAPRLQRGLLHAPFRPRAAAGTEGLRAGTSVTYDF